MTMTFLSRAGQDNCPWAGLSRLIKLIFMKISECGATVRGDCFGLGMVVAKQYLGPLGTRLGESEPLSARASERAPVLTSLGTAQPDIASAIAQW